MNDRFKFRVYAFNKMQTPSEKWGGDVFMRLNGTPYIQLDVQENTGLDRFPTGEDVNIMPCTGLKDKNGKLIYEGDILRKNKKRGHEIIVVTWTAFPYCKAGYNIGASLKGESGWEVIGNIYENPDLLKK